MLGLNDRRDESDDPGHRGDDTKRSASLEADRDVILPGVVPGCEARGTLNPP
jgi:hypothetical protein